MNFWNIELRYLVFKIQTIYVEQITLGFWNCEQIFLRADEFLFERKILELFFRRIFSNFEPKKGHVKKSSWQAPEFSCNIFFKSFYKSPAIWWKSDDLSITLVNSWQNLGRKMKFFAKISIISNFQIECEWIWLVKFTSFP